jgi:hypothetical protein
VLELELEPEVGLEPEVEPEVELFDLSGGEKAEK